MGSKLTIGFLCGFLFLLYGCTNPEKEKEVIREVHITVVDSTRVVNVSINNTVIVDTIIDTTASDFSFLESLVRLFPLDSISQEIIQSSPISKFGNPSPTRNRFNDSGKATYFGKDNYFTVRMDSFPKNITICGWFSIKGEHHPNHMAVLGQGLEYANRWVLSGSRSELTFYDRRGNDNSPYAVNITQSFNTWYCLCATSSPNFPAGKKVKVYLNGDFKSELSSRPIASIDSLKVYEIGRFYNEFGFDFSDGSMDDIMIFNKVLNDDEVKMVYKMRIDSISTKVVEE